MDYGLREAGGEPEEEEEPKPKGWTYNKNMKLSFLAPAWGLSVFFSEEAFSEDGPSDVNEEYGTQQPVSQTVQDSHQSLTAG